MSEYRLVPLCGKNTGKHIKVSCEDFDFASQFRWYLTPDGYPHTRLKVSVGKQKNFALHRLVAERMKLPTKGTGLVTDHINRDKLDARRHNLRAVSRSANNLNRSVQKNSPFQLLGVGRFRDGTYIAKITIMGKQTTVTGFKTLEEAAQTRDALARYYYPDVASTNFATGDCFDIYEARQRLRLERGAKSKYIGIRPVPGINAAGKWMARVGKQREDYIGCFDTEEEAARAVDARKILLGQSTVNFSELEGEKAK